MGFAPAVRPGRTQAYRDQAAPYLRRVSVPGRSDWRILPSMNAPEQDAARLQEITGLFYAGRITRDEARSSVIDVVLARIGCARVSLWKFDAHEGELTLLCFASKVAG